MDGWITIGTDIDGRNFEKELNNLKKESERFEKEEERLLNKKAKLELDTSKTMNNLSKLDKQVELIKKKMSTMEETNLPGNLDSNANYQKLLSQSELINIKAQEYYEKLERQKTSLNEINGKLLENASNQDVVKQKISETKEEASKVHFNFDNMGKSIKDNIKKVGKWAGAIFGIRAALNIASQAMSTISSYNDDMNNKMYSMKMMLASALEPLLTNLVNLAWKLMSYVAYIAKAWFGVDIASKASANSMKAGAKSAEKMKKSLAGFDEMNILNDNGSTGALGASGSQFQMPDMSESNIPSWIKWIADNKAIVLGFFTELGLIWGAIKIADFLLKLKTLKQGLSGTATEGAKATSTMNGFGKIIGGAMILGGLLMITKAVTDLILNWDELTPTEKRAEIALALLGVAFIALGYAIANGISIATLGVGALIGAITALGVGLVSLVAKWITEEESIKSVEQASIDLKEAQEELKQATDDYSNSLDNYDNALKKVEESAKKLEQAEKKNKISGEELFNQVKDGTLTYQDMNSKQKEVYKAYIDNLTAQENLKKSSQDLETKLQNLTDAQDKEKMASWEARLAQEAQNDKFKDGSSAAKKFKDSVIDAYNKGELSAKQARDLIGKSMSGMSRDAQDAFMTDLPNAVKDGLDPKKYETFGQKFSKFFSGLWSGIKSGASSAWNKVKNTFGFSKGGVVSGGSVYGFAKGGITYPKLQYCATGAIVNQPGRGVPVTQAIAGERGAEGILPLTDSQQMDRLGQAIASHMVINLTNINQMNGRILSKEMKKISNQQEFATNS